MTTPTDPARYAGADLRLAAVDMDGTLLDDDKNFPPGMDELLDQMDARGVIFAPTSGRQVWTLIDMFPGRPGMTVIGENGGIVMRDGVEVSSHPVDTPTVREVIRLVRDATSGPDGIDGGLVMCGKQFAYVERTDEGFVEGVMPYYHRTKRVEDQNAIIDAIEAGQIDDAIVKLAVYVIGPVEPLAQATLANFADTHQYAISGANWADLQVQGVDKGSAVRDLQRFLGVERAQTAVFGDAGNDLSMMGVADLSFAMANASADVVEAARFVAPSNNEAGVIQVLRALLK
ncbi:MAG: HAD-IIB family hydrolase [Actinomyces bouchesdurhonensis]|uniref:HAD-IIB family hydrolase n=1 Tax=Actinomyces bouchesdurhonensis TaxID=1852361 RepID=A0A929RP36_9ACTO|nr:HAD-IIB family hydrolase [Actinomyces bouchesdurhonensis]